MLRVMPLLTEPHFEGQNAAYKQNAPAALLGNNSTIVQVAFAALASS
jgi:hypothetical protein